MSALDPLIKDQSETALIVDDEITNRLILRSLLKKQGYKSIEAADGQQAVDLYKEHNPDIIFMDVMMPVMDGYDATRIIKSLSQQNFVPIIFLTAMTDEEVLGKCIDVGGDDFLIKPYDKFLLRTKIESMRRITSLNKEVQGMYSMIHREQEIGEQVFNNAVQKFNIANDHIRTIIKPASTFSGDMILSAYAPSKDLHFLLGDFTGHGLSAALGALPVSEVFRAMTSKGFALEDILLGINKKLRTFLPTGMFLGVQLISVSHDLEHIKVINAGMPDVLLIDGKTNLIRSHIKSKGLALGILDNINVDEIIQVLPIHHGDKLVFNSDGVTEAWNSEGEDFGDDRFYKTIEETPNNHRVFDHIMRELEDFCGNAEQADDVTLVEIECRQDLIPQDSPEKTIATIKRDSKLGEWDYTLTLKGSRLKATNPVPLIINNLLELENIEAEKQNLYTVLTELYVNALDHGVLNLSSSLKSDPSGFAQYFKEREERLNALDSGFVHFTISLKQYETHQSLSIRVEDSGEGFDHENQHMIEPSSTTLSGRGLFLIKELCHSLNYQGKGNIAIAECHLGS